MKNYQLIKIRQQFRNNSITDIQGTISNELAKINPLIKPGSRIAIAVGSRGIRNIAIIVKEIVQFVKDHGALPFIVPAMGSHGGATAEGQEAILEGYGISEKGVGAPVISSMEVVELPQGDSPVKVYMDMNAAESDGVILINRIKPHTDYHSTYESGLVKMSVIGLGKERQASAIHSYGVYGLSHMIPMVASQILLSGKILAGIALVEDAYDNTMVIKCLKADDFFEQEPKLLEIAKSSMPSLPVKDIDVLVVDKMGKDISGVGMDPNIIGRIKIYGQPEPLEPAIKSIVVHELTEGSHGNAIGVGLADMITKKLYDQIDFSATYTNAITSGFLERVKIPFVAKNDNDAFEIALRSCGYIEPGKEKIVRIKSTLSLDEIYVSHAVMDLLNGSAGIEQISGVVDLFNDENEFSGF
jgi:hypothetical protein